MKTKYYSFWFLLMMSLTATIGASMLISFGYVANLTHYNATFIFITWILGGLFIVPETLLMIEPSVSYRINGTAYGWLQKANLKAIGFWFGWILVTLVAAGALSSATLALGTLFEKIINISDRPWVGKLFGVIILMSLAAIQLFVKNSNNKLQIIFTTLTFVPLLLIVLGAFIFGTKETIDSNFIFKEITPSLLVSTGFLIPAISFTMFAYSGVEVSTYLAAEVENPRKTMPKVIIWSTILVILVYVISALALLTYIRTSDKSSNNAIDLMQTPMWFKTTLSATALFLFIGSINSYLVYQTRLVTTLCEYRDLGQAFLKKTKNGSYLYAMLLLLLFTLIFVLTNNLFSVIVYFGLSVSLLKLIMTSTIIYLRKTDADYKKIFKDYIFWIFVFFAYLSCSITLVGSIYSLFLMQMQSELWKPITILVTLILLLPVGFLKEYLRKKYFVTNIANKFKLINKENLLRKIIYAMIGLLTIALVFLFISLLGLFFIPELNQKLNNQALLRNNQAILFAIITMIFLIWNLIININCLRFSKIKNYQIVVLIVLNFLLVLEIFVSWWFLILLIPIWCLSLVICYHYRNINFPKQINEL